MLTLDTEPLAGIDLTQPVDPDHPLNQGLAAWWLGVPDLTGSGKLFDLTDRGAAATVEGTWAGGDVRASGGSGVTLALPYTGAVGGVTYGDSWVLTWWFEPTAYGGAFTPVIDTTDRKPAAFYDTGGNQSFSGDFGALPAGRRYRLAVVFPSTGTSSAAGSFRLYRDGAFVSTFSHGGLDPFWTTTYTVSLGGDLSGGSGQVTAKYGDIRFRRLTAGQPTTVYDAAVSLDYDQSVRGHPDTLRRYAPRVWSFGAAGGGGGSASTGDLSATLGAATSSATGTLAIAGSASVALGAATLSAAGTLAITGSATPTLGAATSSATGTLAIDGTASVTLGAVTSSAAGTLALSGALSATLAAATLSADGGSAAAGDLSATLAAATLSAAGTLPLAGSASPTLAPATSSATGTLALSGSASVTLGAATSSATGALALAAALAKTLGAAALSATGVGAAPTANTGRVVCLTGADPVATLAGRHRDATFTADLEC